MDSKIAKLIEICRYEEDPNWKILKKLFDGVEFGGIQKVLGNRDATIAGLIDDADVETFDNRNDFENRWGYYMEFTDDGFLTVVKPFRALEGFYLPEFGINITRDVSVYFGKGVKLFDVIIRAPTYISEGAEIEHARFQSAGRYNFVGENAKLSNAAEVRGCFISGGPLKQEGRPRTYIHANSINNTILGAYSGIAVGTNVWNHPKRREVYLMVDPETGKGVEFPNHVKYRKLPIFIGTGTTIGPHCLIDCGSIIGANLETDRLEHVCGLRTSEKKYEPMRNR